MAGLATHRSAEPDTLVVRTGFDERACLLEDAPETYYLTDYYRSHPVVLVRLSRIDRDASARSAVRVMAPDLAEGANTRPNPALRERHRRVGSFLTPAG